MLPSRLHISRGQALIEILISLAIFSILTHALLTLVTTTYSVNIFNRTRISARHLAQEKIEYIRNMPYENIGTVGGIPSGNIQPAETFSINDIVYTVNTSVIYIDDPFDELTPDDLLPADYKRVSIEIYWEGVDSSGKNPLKMITDISPASIETTLTGGTLSIYVFDANALPVPQADVAIISTGTDPIVNMTIKTNDSGRVILPGAPVCRRACYQIAVSKDGYSSERTYSTEEVDNPAKPILSVLQGEITESSFAIDKVGTINVNSYKDRSSNFETLPETTFTIRGQKTIGTDSDDNPVYKYQDIFTTDGAGSITLENMEWDNYTIFIDSAVGDISGLNPPPSISLLPESVVNTKMAVSSHSGNSVLISFVNPSGTEIASVSARLYDNAGYEATSSAGAQGYPDFGQVFFPDLQQKIYSLTATLSGYFDYNGNVDSYGYKQQKIILNPI